MYNQYYPNYYSNNNRFGGNIVPFVLGGIAGSLWNNNRPIYFFPPPPFYPIPPYRPRPW
jgi:hypothetical protein